jgi:hypothetical protein
VSRTWIVNVEFPATVGVPLITPVAGFKVNPVGNVPEETLNVKVLPGFPPCAATVVV